MEDHGSTQNTHDAGAEALETLEAYRAARYELDVVSHDLNIQYPFPLQYTSDAGIAASAEVDDRFADLRRTFVGHDIAHEEDPPAYEWPSLYERPPWNVIEVRDDGVTEVLVDVSRDGERQHLRFRMARSEGSWRIQDAVHVDPDSSAILPAFL
jgi:hypothetical protein